MHNRTLRAAPMVVAVLALVFAAVGTATAAKLIGSKDIKNNSIQSADIRNGTIRAVDVQNNSLTGQEIRNGSIGLNDLAPEARPPQAAETDPHWGVIARNTIGSPVAELRSGPFVTDSDGEVVGPPFGEGSLGLAVAGAATPTGSEKASFGNEVDFTGENFLELTDLGFHVFTTGENFGTDEPMPVLNIELDPNLDAPGADDFTTAVWIPQDVESEFINTWSPYIDATTSGGWLLTGGEGTATGCTLSNRCSWDELITALDDGGEPPTIKSLAVSKGRDTAFAGAVDGLRVNDTIYDFEPIGVVERQAEG
jgi:hypothetical protein